jgi:tRNA1(Val) A37 N6-methylase TrmN6
MSGLDSYYTPSPLADKLIRLIAATQVKRAIDFCVGDGDLLKAVARSYEGVELYGTDISDDAINKLSSDYPSWQLAQCDFCDNELLERVSFLKGKKFDLIVLNPPFTCKGSTIEYLQFENQEFKVSTAMHFLMRALRYLDKDGGLYAILPISCVYSEKDRKAWEYLKAYYNACILDEPDRVYFTKNCSPNIVLVYAGRYPVKEWNPKKPTDFTSLPVTDIIRGCVRMQHPSYSRSSKAVKLIHTTNIQKCALVHLKRILPHTALQLDGCGVVIPRVCNPNPNKIAILDGTSTYVLSDCVIVLRTTTMQEAEQVRQYILDNWSDFVTIYKGTGAQYTTLARVKEIFGKSVNTNKKDSKL